VWKRILGRKIRFVAFNVRDESRGSGSQKESIERFKARQRFKVTKIGLEETGEKSHAYLEMDVHSRTAGFGERSRAATCRITTFGAA
jgi:hypothetical protein